MWKYSSSAVGVCAVVLGLIQGRIGVAYDGFHIVAIVRIHGNSQAAGDFHSMTVENKRQRQCDQYLVRKICDIAS